jgi:hypothetical protein
MPGAVRFSKRDFCKNPETLPAPDVFVLLQTGITIKA